MLSMGDYRIIVKKSRKGNGSCLERRLMIVFYKRLYKFAILFKGRAGKACDKREQLSWQSTTLPRLGSRVRIPSPAQDPDEMSGFFFCRYYASVVELVDTQDLKSCDHCGRMGSSPIPGTLLFSKVSEKLSDRDVAQLGQRTTLGQWGPLVRIQSSRHFTLIVLGYYKHYGNILGLFIDL